MAEEKKNPGIQAHPSLQAGLAIHAQAALPAVTDPIQERNRAVAWYKKSRPTTRAVWALPLLGALLGGCIGCLGTTMHVVETQEPFAVDFGAGCVSGTRHHRTIEVTTFGRLWAAPTCWWTEPLGDLTRRQNEADRTVWEAHMACNA